MKDTWRNLRNQLKTFPDGSHPFAIGSRTLRALLDERDRLVTEVKILRTLRKQTATNKQESK